MTRYYCPYCPSKYQFHTKRADGILVCGLCGDPLIKLPLVKPVQIFAIIAALAFISPLIMLISILFESETNAPRQQSASIINTTTSR